MKVNVFTITLFTLISSVSFADSAATLKCTGKNITLEERSPYLGENSEFAQSLFVLKSDENDKESKNTAFFLKTSIETGRDGISYLKGSNEVKGKFLLTRERPRRDTDEDDKHDKSAGTLTYSHGPLSGTDVPVVCITD